MRNWEVEEGKRGVPAQREREGIEIAWCSSKTEKRDDKITMQVYRQERNTYRREVEKEISVLDSSVYVCLSVSVLVVTSCISLQRSSSSWSPLSCYFWRTDSSDRSLLILPFFPLHLILPIRPSFLCLFRESPSSFPLSRKFFHFQISKNERDKYYFWERERERGRHQIVDSGKEKNPCKNRKMGKRNRQEPLSLYSESPRKKGLQRQRLTWQSWKDWNVEIQHMLLSFSILFDGKEWFLLSLSRRWKVFNSPPAALTFCSPDHFLCSAFILFSLDLCFIMIRETHRREEKRVRQTDMTTLGR